MGKIEEVGDCGLTSSRRNSSSHLDSYLDPPFMCGPPLSAAEGYSLHSRYLAKANSRILSEIAEMNILYQRGADSEGHPFMVVVGAHFLRR
ncbi:unnamed protein product [Lactuca virosa]|uniref:Uncharacterized protein n=1 Tax=Lactuca virosa TaxID=75947 RepID=A0AAU9MXH3_9ASTR|nr:unnamed protein product [Lactuca virosa]